MSGIEFRRVVKQTTVVQQTGIKKLHATTTDVLSGRENERDSHNYYHTAAEHAHERLHAENTPFNWRGRVHLIILVIHCHALRQGFSGDNGRFCICGDQGRDD